MRKCDDTKEIGKRYRSIFTLCFILFLMLSNNLSAEGALPLRPQVEKYSSNVNGTDDITSLSNTQLATNGTIYIHFDRPITIDGSKVMLYPRPIGVEKIENNQKKTQFTYDEAGNSISGAAEIQSVTIINKNIIAIKPKNLLLPLHQYRVEIDREAIEDEYEHHPAEDVKFSLWTRNSNETLTPRWEDVKGTNGRYFDAPKYNQAEPILLTIDGEVVPRAGAGTILKEIVLAEGYDLDEEITIERYVIEHYTQNNRKKTKLYLYPKEALDYGKYYRLNIPSHTFETRGRRSLAALQKEFVVKGQKDAPQGTYDLGNNEIEVMDLWYGHWDLVLRGFNFHRGIEKVLLTPVDGPAAEGEAVTVEPKDILFHDITRLTIRLQDDIAQALGRESAVGSYEVSIHFEGGNVVTHSKELLEISPKGRPKVKGTYPSNINRWFNEYDLTPRRIDGRTRYFIEITFEDIDNTLAFNNMNGLSLLKSSRVYPEGGSQASLVDIEFLNYIESLDDEEQQKYIESYIFVKDSNRREARLYLPINQLRSQTNYNVFVQSDIVYFQDVIGVASGNDEIRWGFTTMAMPYVRSISLGSVIEDYDDTEPIYIEGDFFHNSSVTVYFNYQRARMTRIVQGEGGKDALAVYLPRGRARLEPGIYDVVVVNDRDHETITYGTFSVLPRGSVSAPEDGQYVKEEIREGKIIATVHRSEDTLVLDKAYNHHGILEFDLDELMGESTRVRKIHIEGQWGSRISQLRTYNYWGEVSLYNLTLNAPTRTDNIEVRLGPADPHLKQSLQRSLRQYQIKSDLIEVGGSQYSISSLILQLPYQQSNGENLKVLRYDEQLRDWVEERSFNVDVVDQRVRVLATTPGIFVLVE